MIKKLVVLAIVLIMLLCVFSITSFAALITANPTTSTVWVDGRIIPFEAYNIGGNNFFKLRNR